MNAKLENSACFCLKPGITSCSCKQETPGANDFVSAYRFLKFAPLYRISRISQLTFFPLHFLFSGWLLSGLNFLPMRNVYVFSC